MPPDALLRLNHWRVWSDRRFLEATTTLTSDQLNQEFPIGQATVLKTLQHLQAAEQVWISRLTGKPTTVLAELPVHPDLESLRLAWDRSDAAWDAYVKTLTDAELARVFLAINSRGITGHMSVLDVILHVNTHAAYTQAQLNNMLRHLGIKTVDMMLATMSRLEHAV